LFRYLRKVKIMPIPTIPFIKMARKVKKLSVVQMKIGPNVASAMVITQAAVQYDMRMIVFFI